MQKMEMEMQSKEMTKDYQSTLDQDGAVRARWVRAQEWWRGGTLRFRPGTPAPRPPSQCKGEELQLQQQLLLLLVQLLSLGDGAPAAAASLGVGARPLLLPSGTWCGR